MARGVSPDSHATDVRRGPSETRPGAAERARSVLARANGAAACWPDSSPEDGLPDFVTCVMLDQPGSVLSHSRPVVVEVADPAPLPCTERIRARVRLEGLACVVDDSPGTIRLHPLRAELEESGSRRLISPDRLWAAEPDLLATREGAFLSHLATGHAELMRTLTRLLDRDSLEGVQRAVPLALDRYGLVFRLEYRRGHHDVRLTFAAPATSAEEVRAGMRDLALRAHGARPASAGNQAVPEPRRRRFLRDLLQAGPAAARICSPDSEPGR